MKSEIRVTNISLEEGELEIWQYVARDCYKGGLPEKQNPQSLQLSMFSISSAKNKFTAVGFDTVASVTFWRGNRTYSSGCISSGNIRPPTDKGSCSGIGCCQVSIPRGCTNYTISLGSYKNYTVVEDFNSCGYAFVADESKFNFSFKSFNELTNINKVPLVLDWTIGKESCSNSENKKNYACKQNSTCYEPGNGTKGYRCKCKEGYKGNPYLQNQNGCQDVNECEDGSHNCIDKKHCINKEGRFNCYCPKGYDGDGTKNGTRCIADQAKLIEFYVGLGIATAGGFLCLARFCYYMYQRLQTRKVAIRKEKYFKQNGGLLLNQGLSSYGDGDKSKVFAVEELQKATDNFNKSRILGEGGFGTVYKGMLDDGKIVAVKKSKAVDKSQIQQFINEIVILSQINHRNIVKLLGCCLETEFPLLVYEFIPNGTLFDHIHGKNDEYSSLSWENRLKVACEVAEAIAYMHSAASVPIFHRDIKSSNILLDSKYNAKVSDFGTSRSIPDDKTHLTTLVQGTFGYLDPEYFRSSQFTEKSDVYSFGVVLIELLTGEKPVSLTRAEEERGLVAYFFSCMKENKLLQILDNQIAEEATKEDIYAVAYLAIRCLRLNGKNRPLMKEVSMELQGLRKSNRCLEIHEQFPLISDEILSEQTVIEVGETSFSLEVDSANLLCG